jgi:signal transduction histidine kinase
VGVLGIIQNAARAILSELNSSSSAPSNQDLLFRLAHDLKRPLITIESLLSLLRRDLSGQNLARCGEDVDGIESAVAALRQQLTEVLDLARIGRLDLTRAAASLLKPERCDTRRQIELAIANCSTPSTPAAIDIRIDPDLPDVVARSGQVEELFRSLIQNAMKFSLRGEAPRVEIGFRSGTIPAVFFVRDNGSGIPASERERVFDWFVQLDPHAEGNGIGLGIARRITELHGGRIWIEGNPPEAGATVCFTLASEK